MSAPASHNKDLTRLFRTLSDETRYRLLRLLAREELTVNELALITQLAQPRISNHLKILREELLITERREGSWRHYRVDGAELDPAARSLWPALEAAWLDNDDFAADDKRLAEVLDSRRRTDSGSFFDQLAERWDEYRDRLFGDALGREILQIFLPKGLVVADIGTGTGYVLRLFGKCAGKIIAVDNSEGMLEAARHKAQATGLDNVEFRLADAAANPLAPNEADIVTVIQVLHHLEDPAAVIRAVALGLKPGGKLIINDFVEHQENWLKTELHHRWLGFPRQRIEGWIAAAGLRVVAWEILPGRVLESETGPRIATPDSFTAVAVRP